MARYPEYFRLDENRSLTIVTPTLAVAREEFPVRRVIAIYAGFTSAGGADWFQLEELPALGIPSHRVRLRGARRLPACHWEIVIRFPPASLLPTLLQDARFSGRPIAFNKPRRYSIDPDITVPELD